MTKLRKKRKIITGLDIGTSTVKVVVTDIAGNDSPEVIGVGVSKSEGMRNGYIVDKQLATNSIIKALDNAVRQARVRPEEVYLSIGGVTLDSSRATGTAYVSGDDPRVDENTLQDLQDNAKEKSADGLINKYILNEIPISYKIDGQHVYSNPKNMSGTKLEGSLLLVHAQEKHIDDFISATEAAGVVVLDTTPAPLASSFATLDTPQKIQGCILVDIGAESTDVIVFENNNPIALTVLPIGATAITNAIAVELCIPPHEAEMVKKNHYSNDEKTQKRMEKIIRYSASDIFSEVKKFTKEIEGNPLLPAGVLITGGGSQVDGIVEYAKKVLSLPARRVKSDIKGVDHSPELVVAYGLCILGASAEENEGFFTQAKDSLANAGNWFKQFLP